MAAVGRIGFQLGSITSGVRVLSAGLYEKAFGLKLHGNDVHYTASSLLVISKIRVVKFVARKFDLQSLFIQELRLEPGVPPPLQRPPYHSNFCPIRRPILPAATLSCHGCLISIQLLPYLPPYPANCRPILPNR
jgi:hypothetical protein